MSLNSRNTTETGNLGQRQLINISQLVDRESVFIEDIRKKLQEVEMKLDVID